MTIHYLPEEDYKKAIGQFRMQENGVFDFLKVDDKIPVRYRYGMGEFIPGAVDEIVRLSEDFCLRVRGKDKPIDLSMIRRNRK